MIVTSTLASELDSNLADGPPQWAIGAAGGLAVLLFVTLLWLSTGEWRQERKMNRQWGRMTEEQRRGMRTRFVVTLFLESGRTVGAVPVARVEKKSKMGLQLRRIIEDLEHSGWINETSVRAGLVRQMAAFFTPSVRGTHDAVKLTAPGLRTLRKMHESGANDLQVGDVPETVVTVDGEVISVEHIENYFNGPVSRSQFNRGSTNPVQLNGQKAEQIVDQMRQAFGGHISQSGFDQLRKALTEDGSSQIANGEASHTQRWIDAIKDEVPTATATAVTATLKHLLGGI